MDKQNQNQPEQLYVKRLHGKRTSYLPYQPEIYDRELTNEQCMTMVGALAVTVINLHQQLIPSHKVDHRKIEKVKQSVLEMLKGTGKAVDEEMAQYTFDCWNLAASIMGMGAKRA